MFQVSLSIIQTINGDYQSMLRTNFSILSLFLILIALVYIGCAGPEEDDAARGMAELRQKGLDPELYSAADFYNGLEPQNFIRRTGAQYKPSFNEDPAIPAQCWIETGYGTQNACQYCHTDYLAGIGHGNAFPIAEDQVLYSFPTPNLNRILWQNVLFPEEIDRRLIAEGVVLPDPGDAAYVRSDNWSPAFERSRKTGNTSWLNSDTPDEALILFPALDPNHLFPFISGNPTGDGAHGYVDPEGFVRDGDDGYTGWRAINFFPYAIFTPLTGSVSGIYIRLPEIFMQENGIFNKEVYALNLDLLERNIKNLEVPGTNYYGDASTIPVKKGFYPVSTEFAHPLHYVDLLADGEAGVRVNGVVGNEQKTYEFPGTRSKRVKEIRYMYKWKEVGLEDIGDPDDDDDGEDEDEFEAFIGREGQGWVDNGAGWILAAYIEDRRGDLRPQTTEELVQCIGCHANVGNTVDAVWSFQRKLPGAMGWREMNYGFYRSDRRDKTKMHDYLNSGVDMGEMEYFYSTVVGADLYGVMPAEIERELKTYARRSNLQSRLGLKHSLDELFDNEALKSMSADQRKSRLVDRQKMMRSYAEQKEYLYYDRADDVYYIKGSVFYPTQETMHANIYLYRKIVLDQSYNLGKDVFGMENQHVPFTFRSDGSVINAEGNSIPAGEVITSRPYNEEGVGITPTGIVAVNEEGEPIDAEGNPVDITLEPHRAQGHISSGGTFNTMYNPILSDRHVRKD
jgi:hypothetical protein